MHSSWLARSSAVLLASSISFASGCLGGGGSADADPSAGDGGGLDDGDANDDADEPEEGVKDPHTGAHISIEPLAACTRGMTLAEIEDAVSITFDFEQSAHEMVACGGLVFGIVSALVEGIIELAEDPSASTLPEGYTYDGEGTYYVDPATFNDLRMEVRFYLDRDYSFGSRGELVPGNLFLMSSFLQDAQTTIEIDDSGLFPVIDMRIHHEGPGPMVELLGLGPNPPSPIVVTDDVWTAAYETLGALEVEAVIFFRDHPGVSTIEYDVDSPRMLARSFLEGSAMSLNMVGADGWRADLGQDLDVDVWTVEYADGSVGALDGDIDFTVRGGPFDYVSKLRYHHSGWPVIGLECAGQ
ncbi:hypothetical protein [Paraliomyxa miuraensis]|uniref:hypothetical protein n=1 Tax=Paraliomyxa miuraensis TaxID=376150 RepID=UPI002259F031|nr:hypothetical protein [Paraliomyxa miuraensis]MCX4245261.1 hypothetical protein [Paraliomyxa miuraensis]